MKQKLPKFDKRGFTLLEMVVSTLIIGLLVGGAIASYIRVAVRNNVMAAGSGFVSVVRDVQKRSQSGEKPSVCTDTLEGWSLVNVNSGEYTVGVECNGYNVVETFNLPSGVVFSGWNYNDKIMFKVLTGEADAMTSLIIQDSPGSDYEYTISIGTAGGIDVVVN